jgi:hypothetical protein
VLDSVIQMQAMPAFLRNKRRVFVGHRLLL